VPSHPELLEDLSARFIESGWSLKWLHREIMLSAAYRQSSHPRADAMEADPTNTYVWRMNPHRMDIEAYRDSILEASGRLDLTFVRGFCGQREGYAAHRARRHPGPQHSQHPEAVRRAGAQPLPRRKFSSCIEGSSRGTPPPLK